MCHILSSVYRLAVVLLLSRATFAATIQGTVKDPQGAAVPKATVELREVPGPGSPKSTHTDDAGAFQFRNLSGSHYRVRVVSSGFKIEELGVNLESGKDASMEIT